MTEARQGETLRLHIQEPEEHGEVLEGELTSKIERGGLQYYVYKVRGSSLWLAIRPRHVGATVEEVFSGNDVIVNIARPEKDSSKEIPPTEPDPSYPLEFFAIGILRRETGQEGFS